MQKKKLFVFSHGVQFISDDKNPINPHFNTAHTHIHTHSFRVIKNVFCNKIRWNERIFIALKIWIGGFFWHSLLAFILISPGKWNDRNEKYSFRRLHTKWKSYVWQFLCAENHLMLMTCTDLRWNHPYFVAYDYLNTFSYKTRKSIYLR